MLEAPCGSLLAPYGRLRREAGRQSVEPANRLGMTELAEIERIEPLEIGL